MSLGLEVHERTTDASQIAIRIFRASVHKRIFPPTFAIGATINVALSDMRRRVHGDVENGIPLQAERVHGSPNPRLRDAFTSSFDGKLIHLSPATTINTYIIKHVV
jgi:hypothetical protein